MGFQNVAINILAYEPEHWCKVERLENFTHHEQVSIFHSSLATSNLNDKFVF